MITEVRRWLGDHVHILRKVPAAVVAVALLTLVIRNADTPALPDYDLPEGFTPAPPPTTAAPGAQRPDLLAVGGTTTTAVPPNVGRARVSGVVNGPNGAVPGAVVRLERVVGDATQVLDLTTGPDGRYDAAGIGGGRYRVRAFLAPTLAQARGTVFFLRHDEDRTVDLTVAAFADPSIALAVAPNPPLLDQPLNAAVRVSGRSVDAEGFVRSQPLAGVTVTIDVNGGWVATSSTTGSTDGAGEVRFSFECRSTASTQVHVTVRIPAPPAPAPTPADPTATTGTTAPPAPTTVTATFDVADCVDPATLTTTTTTDGSTTTTTSDGSTSTSTTPESTSTSSTTSTTEPP